jgi:hypothetical protein
MPCMKGMSMPMYEGGRVTIRLPYDRRQAQAYYDDIPAVIEAEHM